MGLKFDIQVNIPDKIFTEPATRAEHIVAVQAMKDTSRYVPALTHSLRDRTQVDGGTIIYPGPYARYLYYGKVMVNEKTGAGPMHFIGKNGNEAIKFPKGSKLKATDRNLVLAHSGVDPHATDHWFEVSKANNIDKWVKTAGEEMERERKRN